MTFTVETEQNNKLLLLDFKIICEQTKYITSVYRKPTSSGVYTHFDSFLPNTYKNRHDVFGYALVGQCSIDN